MLQNAHLLAKIGADTAENERNLAENLPKFAKNCQKLATTLRVASAAPAPRPRGRNAPNRGEVKQRDRWAKEQGVSGVPFFVVEGTAKEPIVTP